jgi:YesN/AraC family two-component response regulator
MLHKTKKVIQLVIADDSPRVRHGLRTILTIQPDLEVVGEASHGNEAILLVETKQPDVALLDVRMPVLDGIQATRTIKKRWPEVRVVLISLYADYQLEALSAGADAFLVKGCSVDEIISTIHSLFQADKAGILPH